MLKGARQRKKGERTHPPKRVWNCHEERDNVP